MELYKGKLMALPRQVQAQIKELEELEKQLTGTKEPPKDLESEDGTPNEPPEPGAEQAEETTPDAEPTNEKKPEKPESKEPSEETWQQKYRTLQGMYDAEVPRLHAQVKELTQRLDELQRAPKEADKPKKKELEKLVTDADVETFGQDLIEVQRKVAREVAQEFEAKLEDLRSQNAELRDQLMQTGSQITESTFEQKLHRLVPDFDQINADQRWIDWLNEVDPLLRGPRKNLAQQAFTQGDAEGVAHYVSMFKQTLTPPDAEQPQKKTKELERQIQPNRSSTNATPVSQKGKTYTTAQINAMFRKSAELGGKGKLEEARKIEAEIDAAFMEGRVSA